MKKIVGIIAALSLVAGVAFADEPNVTPTVSAFSGKASIEYDIDLDNEAFGIVNAESAEFKIVFVPETKKKTEGDGLWGELEIKVGKVEVAGGGKFGTLTLEKGDDGEYTGKLTTDSVFIVPGVSVETAKIHFTDDDFYAVMNIKAPSLEVGGGDIMTATWTKKAFPKAGVTLTDKAGFTLNFGLKDVVDFNVQFADNGVKKADAKKFAFVFDASLKAVENLGLYAGVGYGTEVKKLVAAVKADYKLGLTDTLYLKPAVGFALDEKEGKTLNAGVLFGWGKEEQEAKFAKFKAVDGEWDNVCDKVSDGVSIYAGVPIADKAAVEFLASVYDSTLLSGLKMGAQFYTKNISDMKAAGWVADAAVAYASGDLLGDWKLSANFGLEILSKAEVKAGFLWGCGIDNSAIIDNTKLYVNYSGQAAKDIGNLAGDKVGKDVKGTIKIGAEISF